MLFEAPLRWEWDSPSYGPRALLSTRRSARAHFPARPQKRRSQLGTPRRDYRAEDTTLSGVQTHMSLQPRRILWRPGTTNRNKLRSWTESSWRSMKTDEYAPPSSRSRSSVPERKGTPRRNCASPSDVFAHAGEVEISRLASVREGRELAVLGLRSSHTRELADPHGSTRTNLLYQQNRPSHPHERIHSVGGINPDGTRWKLPLDRAIAGIESGTWRSMWSAPPADQSML